MPGIPTQFVLLDEVRQRLAGTTDPELIRIRDALNAEPAYAHLGAVGPAIGDFMPSSTALGGLGTASPYMNLWRNIFAIAGGDGTANNPGLLAVVDEMTRFLDKLDQIAADEDLGALVGMRDSGEVDTISQTADNLRNIVQSIEPIVIAIAATITSGMKPAVTVAPGATVPPPVVWAARDFLHWKRPGKFARNLVRRARDVGDKRMLAYAYGWLSAYVGDTCGSPFRNSVVESVQRLHWWRARWVDTFIDAWVYGQHATGATMSGDVPNPKYEQWPSLCDAQLHDRLTMPGVDPVDLLARLRDGTPLPTVLPAEINNFWFAAFEQTYGTGASARVDATSLNGAYLMTWLMLWFQTSGSVLGCNPTPPIGPPTDCSATPSWIDPTVPGDSGTGSTPPSPTVESDPDEGKIVSGIVLALLGLLLFVAGAWPAGAAALGGGVALIISGASAINWAKLRCDLYWYRLYLYNGLNALHGILVLGGFAHPYARELALDEVPLKLLGIDYTFDSGKRIVRSRSLETFPARAWGGVPATWTMDPTQPAEQPLTVPYLTGGVYPDFFLHSLGNPLSNGRVRDPAMWPPGYGTDTKGSVRQFGNAADNVIDVLSNLDELPDWNLDADRGLAYLTWEFTAPYSSPVSIGPEA